MTSAEIDPRNPVVRLCAAGIEAEMAGATAEARATYEAAWQAAVSAYDRAIAAHYVARLVATDDERLRWNRRALSEALRVTDRQLVAGFLPSLHLNLGHSYETQGDLGAALDHYRQGRASLHALGADPYAAVVRGGLEAAEQRMRSSRNGR
jgi:hypothetical protein